MDIYIIFLLQCIAELLNGVHGALVQRKGKHVVSKEEMKQGLEKSYNFLLQRAIHARIQMRQENVLYEKRNATGQKRV